MFKIKKDLFMLILLSLSYSSFFGQNNKFKKYGIQQGICHPFVYTINQDKNGFIWIGTGEGLCIFDGFDFSTNTIENNIKDVVNYSFKDSKENLWFGFNNGTLLKYDGKTLKTIKLLEKNNSSFTCITENNKGQIFASTSNNGIIQVENDKEIKRYGGDIANKIISAIEFYNENLIIGSQDGLELYQLTNKEYKLKSTFKELSYVNIKAIKKIRKSKDYWIGTEDNGVFRLEFSDETAKLKKVNENIKQDLMQVQSLFEDNNGDLWISTLRNGLFKLLINSKTLLAEKILIYNNTNGLPTNYIKQVFEDRENNIWVATYGEGLVFQMSESLSYLNFPAEGINNNITAVCVTDKAIWMGGGSGLLKAPLNSGDKERFFGTKSGLPNDQVTALYYDKDGNLWIGTNQNGIYILNTTTQSIRKFDYASNSMGNSVNSITGIDDLLYIASKDGIYYYNSKDKRKIHYSTLLGLPHNDIEHLFFTASNQLLFATRSNGIYQIDDIGEIKKVYNLGNFELEFSSITQDKNGTIWASTYGSGIYVFKKDTFINITTRQNLKSDYCYSIITSEGGYIWVGHRLGLSRIDIRNYSITVFDMNKGVTGDCNFNSNFRDSEGKLYFGTTEGLIVYNPKKETLQDLTPKTNIVKLIISDKVYQPLHEILLPYSAYKIRIEFIGLYYKDPATVRYKYKLHGYDPDWSELTDMRYVLYPRVEDGEYTFELRSFNNEGESEELPVKINIKIKLPFYKTWWFISISALIIMFVVYLIIKVRERKQKQLQEYLEQKLAERTKEVVEQKEEIEIKNKDITDSINYAQRIQASILPPIKRLQSNFSGSFVYYLPRDIVSGDFYWFDKVSANKFIIVCADSTGHGVPGAFMSMIGTTLIKDICMGAKFNSPSEILTQLDSELRNTLNQNLEAEKSNDGMDIIVSEIDLKTMYLRYASAMRPMIVYKDGEEVYIKGSRSSVGGHYDKSEKGFQDEGLQLSKGDIIYMFSDGYPDQFGGPIGKKYKMVRLKNLLKDIHQKPMEEQYKHIKNTFALWQDFYPQVDDVLFMGIKI